MDLISLVKKVCLSVPKLNSINLLERFVVLFMEEEEKRSIYILGIVIIIRNIYFNNVTLITYVKPPFLKLGSRNSCIGLYKVE